MLVICKMCFANRVALVLLLLSSRKLLSRTRIAPHVNLGQVLQPNEFPYVGVLALVNYWDQELMICTGTLITGDLVLTAAHCIVKNRCEIFEPKELRFCIGDVLLSPFGQVISANKVIQVKQIYWHQLYAHDTEPWVARYDIGLVKLETPLTLDPATLYQSAYWSNGAGCIGIGGGMNRSNLVPGRVQKAPMPIRDHSVCRPFYGIGLYDPTFNLCAKDPSCINGHCPDVCNGDSGSPLICPSRVNPEIFGLLAIYSRGIFPCGDTFPKVYVKVDPFVNWLNEHATNFSSPINWYKTRNYSK